jgi:formylglycine-generating enzyme required for sulfatase activity
LGGELDRWRVPPFEIGPTEISVGEFRPYDNFHRQDGRANNLPASRLSWDEAVHYAESQGLRLPDLIEAELLATAAGTQQYAWGNDPPVADNWDFQRPLDGETLDRSKTHPQITGLSSGVLEWTLTRTHVGIGSDMRPGLRYVVRGGPASLIEAAVPVGPWASVNQYRADAAVGVRLARSPGPRLKPEDFIARLADE